ncbi:MAG: hypothetical protein ABH883_01935, partial [Candidatus Omnitrophota bacterium]
EDGWIEGKTLLMADVSGLVLARSYAGKEEDIYNYLKSSVFNAFGGTNRMITKSELASRAKICEKLWSELKTKGYIETTGAILSPARAMAGEEDFTLESDYAGKNSEIYNYLKSMTETSKIEIKSLTPPEVFNTNSPKVKIDLNALKQYAIDSEKVLTFEGELGPP